MHVQFDKILDCLISAIIVVDDSLSIIYMNAAAESLLGAGGTNEGKVFHRFFTETDDTPFSIMEAYRNNQNFTKRRSTWHLHNHQETTVDYTVTPDLETGQIVIEVQPLDRLLRISREEAWLASQETTNNMVRSMAHEIKNPLGGIRGAAQLLARELKDHDLEEFTRIIIGETDRLRNLTDRMLGPTKPIRHKPVSVHEVLEHVASVVRMEAQNSVRLKKDYDPSIPDLLGDKEQLIQAAMNIVRNALQALTENTIEAAEICLKTRVKRRYTIGKKTHRLVAQISIIDNGPGIAPEMVEDIFYPMITGRAEGTGLGLAISQNLIRRHEGLIECSSQPGNTEFTIYLPLENTDA